MDLYAPMLDKASPSRNGRWLLAAIAVAFVAAVVFLPPIQIDSSYQDFNDQRQLFDIPNFWNVISNLAFAVAGVVGLGVVLRPRSSRTFEFTCERWAYAVFFAAIALTSVGSAYYHLKPGNDRLVWDRLPMSIAFMALFAAATADFVDPKLALRLLGPLVAIGIGSVFAWHRTAAQGREDLRLYGAVQLLPMVAIPLMLALLPGRYTRKGDFIGATVLYGLAKVFEILDREVFAAGQILSGHTLKHLAAAMGVAIIARMLVLRNVQAPAPISVNHPPAPFCPGGEPNSPPR